MLTTQLNPSLITSGRCPPVFKAGGWESKQIAFFSVMVSKYYIPDTVLSNQVSSYCPLEQGGKGQDAKSQVSARKPHYATCFLSCLYRQITGSYLL